LFNVEPQENWNVEDIANFEAHVAARQKKTIKDALWAGGALLLNILCIVPFSRGHFLHSYAEPTGRILVYLAMGLLLWFVLRVAFIWSSWQSARETRREFGDPQ
jgi:protein-S-isoprenylcysteine O-methyltransferase Ste14